MPSDALRATGPRQLAWYGILAITLASSIAFYLDVARVLPTTPTHIACDFLVFWTAAAAASPYDFEVLTAAQFWYIQTDLLRPFAYPPSFLPWIMPFARLPMGEAYVVWTAGTALIFATVWSRFADLRVVLAALASPVAAMAVIPGQMVFLQSALVVGGIACLRSRPVIAGLLLGLAATIKPQTLLFVPFALAAGGYWRSLAWAATGGFIVGAASLAAQGSGVWLDWLQALPRFMDVVRETGVLPYGITPSSALDANGVGGAAATAVKLISALLGLSVACIVFRCSGDLGYRILALTCGTLLALPYAMPYELAVAAPAAVALLFDRRQPPFAWLAAFLFLIGAGQALALVVMGATVVWLALREGRSPVGLARLISPAARPEARPAG